MHRRARKHPTLPAIAGAARGQRVEHEYQRMGALCYEQIATPFEWKFTRTDLNRLLNRVDQPAALVA
jgi:hypothetical protein